MDLPSRKKNRLEMFLYKEGYFFITVNVQHHEKVFGNVVNEEMQLNQYGETVKKCRLRLGEQYPYVSLGAFVVMPNHFHGLICIDSVGDVRERPLRSRHKSLGSLIAAFKTVTSKKIHELGFTEFQWQRSFYDHVIRNGEDLQAHQEYIDLNAYARKNDEYYR